MACVSDELHAVGGRMVADFLEADGWRVAFLGQLTPGQDLAALAAEQGAQLVALSAALPERVPQVAEVCAALRGLDPAPFVLVGGQAFGGSAERALRTGADAYARRRGDRGGRGARALRGVMIREQIEGYTWDSTAMLAAVLSPDGTVIDANPALERLARRPARRARLRRR